MEAKADYCPSACSGQHTERASPSFSRARHHKPLSRDCNTMRTLQAHHGVEMVTTPEDRTRPARGLSSTDGRGRSRTTGRHHRAETAPRQLRRPNQACLRCRKRKVKCPGSQPCHNCSRTGHECAYDDAKKALVSEEYLQELRRHVSRTGATIESETSRPGITEESVDEQIANPLTSNEPSSAKDSLGRHHFIGSSSTWGFAWRVRRLLFTLPACATIEGQLDGVDDAGYAQIGESVPTEIRDARLLPPATSERYVSNYAYYIAPIWHFIDLSRHSNEIRTPARNPRKIHSGVLWHIQINLVLSIGKLLEQGSKHERSPGDSHFFFALSSMARLEESQAIAEEPILMVENFCLIAFYYHSINMRNDAYVKIGTAMRIAFTQGLHRVSKATLSDVDEQEHLVRLWWSLYSLDLMLSSLMGAPVPVGEDEIVTRAPQSNPKFLPPEPLIKCSRMATLIGTVLSGPDYLTCNIHKH